MLGGRPRSDDRVPRSTTNRSFLNQTIYETGYRWQNLIQFAWRFRCVKIETLLADEIQKF